jgi:hypothetical protein
MNEFSVKSKFETQIRNIWENEKYKEIENITKRGFAVQDIILKNSIMFIGINPSFEENSQGIHHEFYVVEKEGRSHPYFNKFKDISKRVKCDWTHFDLLFLRETNQNSINEIYSKPNGVDFVLKQLEISKKVIIEAKPIVLIVSNTMARHLMGFDKNEDGTAGVWMGFDFVFDESLGTHKIVNNSELENTPVFFTSMLTGQRALDNGSFERLVWHIKFVLNGGKITLT